MWAWLSRCRLEAINLRHQPCTKSVWPVRSEKFVYERDNNKYYMFIGAVHLFLHVYNSHLLLFYY